MRVDHCKDYYTFLTEQQFTFDFGVFVLEVDSTNGGPYRGAAVFDHCAQIWVYKIFVDASCAFGSPRERKNIRRAGQVVLSAAHRRDGFFG
jgi:hypothetical protein